MKTALILGFTAVIATVAGWVAAGRSRPTVDLARLCARMDLPVGCAAGRYTDGGCACSEIHIAPGNDAMAPR